MTLLDAAPPVLSFFVAGHPATAGSKVAVPITKGGARVATRVVESGDRDRKRAWRTDVREAALAALEGEPVYDGPVAVVFAFYRLRPKSHYGSGRNDRVLKVSAPAFPTARPDVLKMARAVEDALLGIVWTDDAAIVDERLSKRWACRFEGRKGVSVSVRRL